MVLMMVEMIFYPDLNLILPIRDVILFHNKEGNVMSNRLYSDLEKFLDMLGLNGEPVGIFYTDAKFYCSLRDVS